MLFRSVLVPPPNVLRRGQDVVQVRREQLLPVAAADAEREPALLLGELALWGRVRLSRAPDDGAAVLLR